MKVEEIVNCYVCGEEIPKTEAYIRIAGPHQLQEYHCGVHV